MPSQVLVIDEAYGLNPAGSQGGGGTADPFKVGLTRRVAALLEASQACSGACASLDPSAFSFPSLPPVLSGLRPVHTVPSMPTVAPTLGITLDTQEAVIDTLVARIQGVPGDDRCVLLLGYEEPMQAMMREANPGLARRFQLANAWWAWLYALGIRMCVCRASILKLLA